MVAPYIARTMPQLLSVECWGGATYDVALRFLKGGSLGAAGHAARGDPQHLPADAAAGPKHRRLHALSGTGHPAFVEEATATGIDIFRIFDALNNLDSMRPAIDAVRETGSAIAEVAMCYTGDLADPGERLYTLDYYLNWPSRSWTPARTCWPSRTWPDCCGRRPPTPWSARCAAGFDLPVHVHTHDTPGGQLATYLAAWQAGADAVDGASRADGRHHQPAAL